MHSGGTDEICHGKHYGFIVFIQPSWDPLLIISAPPPFPPICRFLSFELSRGVRRSPLESDSLSPSSITCGREELDALI